MAKDNDDHDEPKDLRFCAGCGSLVKVGETYCSSVCKQGIDDADAGVGIVGPSVPPETASRRARKEPQIVKGVIAVLG